MDDLQTNFNIPGFKQLYGRLLGFGKVFRFRKIEAVACRFFVVLAPQKLQLEALAPAPVPTKMLGSGLRSPGFKRLN